MTIIFWEMSNSLPLVSLCMHVRMYDAVLPLCCFLAVFATCMVFCFLGKNWTCTTSEMHRCTKLHYYAYICIYVHANKGKLYYSTALFVYNQCLDLFQLSLSFVCNHLPCMNITYLLNLFSLNLHVHIMYNNYVHTSAVCAPELCISRSCLLCSM